MEFRKRTAVLLSAGAAAIALAVYGGFVRARQPSAVHYHAGFLVFIDGVIQDYSADKYMEIVECGTKAEDPVHLHGNVGDVVHVHKAGVVWGDLIRYLNLDETKTAVYLSQPIKPYESIHIFIGDKPNLLPPLVTRERILQVEQLKEVCGN